MADLKALSKQHDTSIEILQAIVDQHGDEQDRIKEVLENPEDFDALATRARGLQGDKDEPLRWQGREIP